MVVKSNAANATQAATRRLEKVIESHRKYFSEWRSNRFDRSSNDDAKPSDKDSKISSKK